ncbi:peptidyl-tRNA hydrolase [Planomonospora parontospora subsp. parontospora]|uniref:peptidyl-tRNA hydrolase n=2 Tax=Planomonospora parontospora TaxID=58119 RepID=A0AA37F434_9ACTN|nr:aminoacyl-tRNA hydrolase [Planomonospora parontospora]GGK64574.1 peptidyl-tRNA hydrolase [Planomonospora parontospora]GII08067.1 peptidyl-tRNA hydrolase [Planomonospora parontospora subsp. parontospora]
MSEHDTLERRDTVEQRVLPLVVRIERSAPPERTDALEAAALAVLALLGDARAAQGGEWAEAVRSWERGRIRKVVRRARGAEWRRVLELPGLTVAHGTAEVRVHPPVPLDAWPRELARLQVSGTELADSAEPGPPGEGAVLWINPRLAMSAGKAMAQAGHAAQFAWWGAGEEIRREWRARGFAIAVRTADPADWAALSGGDLPVVRDAGFTEIEPGSCTVVADASWLRPGGFRAGGSLRGAASG